MTIIRQNDFIQSIADALQYISYYHPKDYIDHLARAYEREQSPAAKDAIAQILTNSRMCAEGHRPICQDTGHRQRLPQDRDGRALGGEAADRRHGERGRAPRLQDPDNTLRASVLADPLFTRKNTRDNTPAVDPHGARPGRHGRRERRGEGRRLGEQDRSSRCSTRPTRSSTGC